MRNPTRRGGCASTWLRLELGVLPLCLSLGSLVVLGCADDAMPSAGTGGSTSSSTAVGTGTGAGTGTAVGTGTGTGGGTGPGTGGDSATGTGGGDGGSGGVGGAAPSCDPGQPAGPLDVEHALVWNEDERTYRVHLPPGYPDGGPYPVVLMFHGYFENGAQFETISQMTPAADARGVVVVYADGRSPVGDLGSWNAGACCGTSASDDVDDVGFVGAMLDEILATYCIDDRRVYASGFSNGGMLSHRLACEMSDRITAIGTTAGPLAIETCAPTRPVPVMHTHGTSDFVVLWEGGGLGASRSVDDTIATWVDLDGCTDSTPTEYLQNGDATCVAWTECAEGAEVRLCTIEGGGHQWPGGESAGPGGTLSDDLQTSEELLQFFLGFALPPGG